jgi:cell division septation protein DedD
VIVTMDTHLASASERAGVHLRRDFPGMTLRLHAASEWGAHPAGLERCVADIEQADIVIATMLFMEDHFLPLLPALQARRDRCDAMVCMMSAPEVVRLTRLGRFDMSRPASGPIALLKRLRGDSRDKPATLQPGPATPARTTAPATPSAPNGAGVTAPAPGSGSGSGPAPAAAPAAAEAEARPRCDFSTILPGVEQPATDQDLRNRSADPKTATRELFFLQAGAFQNAQDADNLKARLALLGLEASIQTANLGEKGTWHRVRLGPYEDADAMGRARSQLAGSGIEAASIKVREKRP